MVMKSQQSEPSKSRRWHAHTYHPAQAKLWRTKARFVAVPAGRGGGKTEIAKRRLVMSLAQKKPWIDPRYFYAAPTRDQAKRIAWDDLKALIPKNWLHSRSVSESELTITTVFGSSVSVVGFDKPQRIEGVQWDGCVIDESCDVRPKVFDLNVLPALTWRDGWCWRIGVPKRQGIGASEFRRWYNDILEGRIEDAEAYTWVSADVVPPKVVEWARQNLDKKDFDEQFNAKFVNAGGGIFHAFDESRNVRPCPYRPDLPIIVASDFNVDPMAWVLCHVVGDTVEVFDELYERDTNTPACLNILWNKYGTHQAGFHFYGDAASRQRKTSASKSDYILIQNDKRFKRAGRKVSYRKSNPPVADRFASCNYMLCNAAGQRRIFIDKSCVNLTDDLVARSYKPGTNDPDGTGDIGHISDALGYFIHYKFPIKIAPSQGARIVLGGQKNG